MLNIARRLRNSIEKRIIPGKARRKLKNVAEPDIVIGLPLPYPLGFPMPAPRVAVMLHAFHIDEVPRILDLLRNIPFSFDTFVTTDTEAKAGEVRAMFSGSTAGSIDVIVTENRGRDVAPRFVSLRRVYGRFDYVLHVHTKKSLHDATLKGWSAQLFGDLIGSRETILSIFELFDASPRLGIVAPRYFPPLRSSIVWGANLDNCAYLARRMGFGIPKHGRLDFAAGSMFWARTAALRPLLELNLSETDFDAERGQRDGTLAHAVERMVFYCSEWAGYDWLLVGDSARHERFERVVRIKSRSDLAATLGREKRSLFTGPKTKTKTCDPVTMFGHVEGCFEDVPLAERALSPAHEAFYVGNEKITHKVKA